MPEQAEWTGDSGDYRWHPNYARQAVKALHAEYPTSKPVVPPYSGQRFDLRTVGERVQALEAEVAELRRRLDLSEGTL